MRSMEVLGTIAKEQDAQKRQMLYQDFVARAIGSHDIVTCKVYVDHGTWMEDCGGEIVVDCGSGDCRTATCIREYGWCKYMV